MTRPWSGTSLVTTAPAPTMAKRPMETPGRTVQPPPIDAPSATVTPLTVQSSSRLSSPARVVARGRLSLSRQECGPTNTPDSRWAPRKTETRFSSLTRSAMTTSASTYTPLARMQSRPIRAPALICASFQTRVPSPTVACGETSAVG